MISYIWVFNGYKNLTLNEWYFPVHFPGKPIMPRTIQLEALEEVSEQMGWGANIWKPLRGILRYQKNKILG